MITMKKMSIIISAAVCAALLMGCQKDTGIPDWPWYDETDPDVWEQVDTLGKLPDYIKVYGAAQGKKMKGRYTKAYLAVVDLNEADFHVWGLIDPELTGSYEGLQTPTNVFNNKGNPSIVVNGGFFYQADDGNGITKSYAASLAVENGELLSPNINYASEDWSTIYYPTRGVFVRHNDNTCEAAWTYWQDSDNHFLYQEPAANSWASEPLEVPSAIFPCPADELDAKTAIGGGPVLIKNGKIVNSYVSELFDGENSGIGVNDPAPRSAIGITADNKLVLYVCEGREMTSGIPGYTTEEVAKILLSFGCIEALNLDGGGSSCMLVNGYQTILPSDGAQRPVGSCIYVK